MNDKSYSALLKIFNISYPIFLFIFWLSPSSVIGAEQAEVNRTPHLKSLEGISLKYRMITGSPDTVFFLHYCLPDFSVPSEGKCAEGRSLKSKRIVQVEYNYAQESGPPPFLEGAVGFIFAFPMNKDIQRKTPYLKYYDQHKELAKKRNSSVFIYPEPQSQYDALTTFGAKGMPGNFRIFIPTNLKEVTTKIGSPPVFMCFGSDCYLALDLGNGWLVRAKFDESALKDWKNFYLNFSASINEIIE